MPCFEQLTDRIYRLKVPFENIYTSVFLVEYEDGYMLVDCATTASDAELILSAIDNEKIDRSHITHILLTHVHGDHAGGFRYLLPYLPNATVCAGSRYAADRLGLERFLLLSDGQSVADGIEAVTLPGHSSDSVGYLDTESMILITGDAVQLCGVGRYGCGVGDIDAYLASLDKIEEMELDRIIASHDYYPYGAVAEGREDINRYLSDSRAYAEYILRECKANAEKGVVDSYDVCDLIRAKNAEADPSIPPLQVSTVAECMKKYM